MTVEGLVSGSLNQSIPFWSQSDERVEIGDEAHTWRRRRRREASYSEVGRCGAQRTRNLRHTTKQASFRRAPEVSKGNPSSFGGVGYHYWPCPCHRWHGQGVGNGQGWK